MCFFSVTFILQKGFYQLKRGRKRKEVWHCEKAVRQNKFSWQAVVFGTIVLQLAQTYRNSGLLACQTYSIYCDLLAHYWYLTARGLAHRPNGIGVGLTASHTTIPAAMLISSSQFICPLTGKPLFPRLDLADFSPSSLRWWYRVDATLQIKITLMRHLNLYGVLCEKTFSEVRLCCSFKNTWNNQHMNYLDHSCFRESTQKRIT